MLDGARNSSAFFSNNTLPLEASIRIAVGASPSKPPSSFLNPWTLWLAAITTPPQPTAIAIVAAIRPDPRVNFERRERCVAMAIGDALSPAFCGRSMMCSESCNSWDYPEQPSRFRGTAAGTALNRARGRPGFRWGRADRSAHRPGPISFRARSGDRPHRRRRADSSLRPALRERAEADISEVAFIET